MSAATALERRALDLAAHLEANPEVSLADVAATLQTGRQTFAHRRFVVAESLPQAIERLRGVRDAGVAICVHGDYHLGQAMRTDSGWYVLDFEGEPARPIDERRRPSSPLRDVAGMLRSFAYAISAVEIMHGKTPPPDFEIRARDAFLDRYFAEIDMALMPAGEAAIVNQLSIFELEKAIYELGYELDNRPDWVSIPVAGIQRVLESQ